LEIVNKTQGKGFKMSCNSRNGSVCTAKERAGRWGTLHKEANHEFCIQLCYLLYGVQVLLTAVNGFVWGSQVYSYNMATERNRMDCHLPLFPPAYYPARLAPSKFSHCDPIIVGSNSHVINFIKYLCWLT